MCPVSNILASKLGESSFIVAMIDTALNCLVISPNSSDVIKLVENRGCSFDLSVSQCCCWWISEGPAIAAGSAQYEAVTQS